MKQFSRSQKNSKKKWALIGLFVFYDCILIVTMIINKSCTINNNEEIKINK